MTRRRTIVPRTPVFLGCEGESEVGYAALLNRLFRETPGLHLHIHVELLQPGAGDPHALVTRAVQKIVDIERRREAFAHRAILLDEGTAQKNATAAALAAQNGIGLIWQRPDHEGFLLRHLDGCLTLRPPAGASLAAIRQNWPDYAKGQTQVQLAERITLDRVIRAASVEDDLKAFLRIVGVIGE